MGPMTSAAPKTMDGDASRDLDRLIESVYADAFDLDWRTFRESSLRLLCEWSGASGAAWCVYVSGKRPGEIGRAHVRTPVTNAHLVCRLLLENKNTIIEMIMLIIYQHIMIIF